MPEPTANAIAEPMPAQEPAEPVPARSPLLAQPAPIPAPAEPRPAAAIGTATVNWFKEPVRGLDDWAPNRPPRPVEGNLLTPYIHVGDYYNALGQTIRAARGELGDFIYLAGWTLDLGTYLDPPGGSRQTLADLLKAAVARKVAVRVLLDSSTLNVGASLQVAAAVQALGGGAVVDPFRHLLGSQHQKFVVARTGEGLVGYCGSADLQNIRLARDGVAGPAVTHEDFLTDSNKRPQGANPWHEVQARVQGGAAADLWQSFLARWQSVVTRLTGDPVFATAEAASTEKHLFGPMGLERPDAVAAKQAPGKVAIQVVRTLPNPARTQPLVNLSRLPAVVSQIYAQLAPVLQRWPPGAPGYQDFAPAGEIHYYLALVAAIDRASRWIYLEDQYLVDVLMAGASHPVTTALARTLAKPEFEKLVIIIAGTDTVQPELLQAGSRRRQFYNQLGAAAASKVSVYWNRFDQNSPFWFHSKTWVFDDACAVIGSANCNRRSYSCDSEIGLVCVDRNSQGLSQLKRLRMDLFLKHLNTPAWGATSPRYKDVDVEDFTKGVQALDRCAAASDSTLMAAPIATDGRGDLQPSAGQLGPLAKLAPYASRIPRDVQWDVLDPDGS